MKKFGLIAIALSAGLVSCAPAVSDCKAIFKPYDIGTHKVLGKVMIVDVLNWNRGEYCVYRVRSASGKNGFTYMDVHEFEEFKE